MLAALAGEPVIAVDTESDSLYRYYHRTCLIQISTPDADYIVDPLSLPDVSSLGPIMADPRIEKVFHAAENDILVMKRDFGFSFANIFDTMLAARILGWPRVSLAAVLEGRFGIALDKRAQLTDWGHRPLTPAQLRYAAMDTHLLLPLRDLLERELRAHRRWREAQEAFAALPDVQFIARPFDPDGYWYSKAARGLQPEELAIFRELYLWRETEARARDCPPFKVLNDETMATLSRQQPRRPDELPRSVYRDRDAARAVLDAIARGRMTAPPAPPRRPREDAQRPDPAAIALYDRLRAWRSARAAERGVDADVVLTNQALLTIARAAPAGVEQLAALGVLGAWKLEEYGSDLLAVVAGR
jgi:ribonuclease D